MSRWGVFALTLLVGSSLAGEVRAACTSIPNSFTNGNVADAGQVNANFTYLGGCAAPENSPVFGGAGVGIFASASNALDIIRSQNSGLIARINNGNAGAGAFTAFRTENGAHQFDFALYGTGASAYGAITAGNAAIYTTSAGLVLMSDNGSGVIKFAAGGSGEDARFGSDGSFIVGTSTNGGWTGNARMEVKKDSAQAISAWMAGSGTAIQARVDNTGSNLINFYYTGGTQVGSLITDGTNLRVNSANTGYLALNGGNYYLWADPAFYPASDNARTLGTSSFRWSEVFAANGTINTSDRREKSKIRPIAKARDIVLSVEAKAFTKYGKDRMGFLAQDVRASLEKYGVGRDTVQGNEAVGKLGLYEADMIAPLWSAARDVIEQADRQNREIQQLKRENQSLSRQVRDLLTAVAALERVDGQRLDKHAESARARAAR